MRLPKPIKRILFVCYGNLCRSVLAEALMKRLQTTRGLDHLAVGSAGIGALPGYPAPAEIVEVAQEQGLDVTGHRSRLLSSFLFDWADIILVMESYMRDEIGLAWPEKDLNKIFLLASFAIGNALYEEIHDPFGGSPDDFKRCYAEIETSVHGLFESLVSKHALTPDE